MWLLKSIPATFKISQYPLLSSKLDPYKPVLQERSKQETKGYCKLVFILITKAHATGGGVRTIFENMPKHSSYIQNTPQQYPLLSSKLDPYKPVLQERSKQETKGYCKCVIILITKAHATGGGV